jgi:hypothetical protein
VGARVRLGSEIDIAVSAMTQSRSAINSRTW